MRKKIVFIIVMACIFILSGCSTKKASLTDTDKTADITDNLVITPTITITEALIPTSTPAEVQYSETDRLSDIRNRALKGEIIEIQSGDSFDLDADGQMEQITYTRSDVDNSEGNNFLTIGNTIYEFYSGFPTEKIYISHMLNYGEELQILIDDFGPSDDYSTKIFYYKEGKIYDLGSVGNLAEQIRPLGDGIYECYERAQTLQTWFHKQKFYLSDVYFWSYDTSDEYAWEVIPTIVRLPKEMYPVGTRVRLKRDLLLYQTQQSSKAEVELKENQFATIAASDDQEWIYIQSDDNQFGWLRIQKFDVYIGEELIYAGDIFGGLIYAD